MFLPEKWKNAMVQQKNVDRTTFAVVGQIPDPSIMNNVIEPKKKNKTLMKEILVVWDNCGKRRICMEEPHRIHYLSILLLRI